MHIHILYDIRLTLLIAAVVHIYIIIYRQVSIQQPQAVYVIIIILHTVEWKLFNMCCLCLRALLIAVIENYYDETFDWIYLITVL